MRLPHESRNLEDPDVEDNYSLMAADEITASMPNPMVGRVVSRGRLMDRDGSRLVLAAFNFTPVTRSGYRLGVPRAVDRQEQRVLEARARQAEPLALGQVGLGDVDEGYPDRFGHLFRQEVHGVGADQQALRPRLLYTLCGFDHEAGQSVPSSRVLQIFDLGEFHRVENASGRMAPSQPLVNSGVDQTVIFDGGMPGHPPQ